MDRYVIYNNTLLYFKFNFVDGLARPFLKVFVDAKMYGAVIGVEEN